jgi:hypothetical protein
MRRLNITDDEARKLGRELPDLTGQSMTAAVIEALRERSAYVTRDAEEHSAPPKKCADEPRLKGNDFIHTDITPALRESP